MLKHTNSKFVKIGVYTLMGFLVLVIIVTFALPSDWVRGMNKDPNVAATVGDEKIYNIDVARKIDDLSRQSKEFAAADQDTKTGYVMNLLIKSRLELQYAKSIDIEVSLEAAKKSLVLKFVNPSTKKFEKEFLQRYLERINLSTEEAVSQEKDALTLNEMYRFLYAYGISPLSEDIAFQNSVDKSSFQLKFAFLSNDELKKKNAALVSVTDAEIDAEMASNKKEIENPATDRIKFKDKVIERKISEAKKSLVSAINSAAEKGDSFDKTAGILGGKTGLTDPFKPGDLVKEQGKDGKSLESMINTELFVSNFATLKIGASSKAVLSSDGIYIFSPVKKEFKIEKPSEKEYSAVVEKVYQERRQGLQASVMMPFWEKLKIERSPKN